MSCIITVSEDQTEFEFFQQMKEHVNDCCGPVVQIGFTEAALTEVFLALGYMGIPLNVLDSYDSEVLDLSHVTYFMCSNHWTQLSTTLGKAALENKNELWMQISFYIFRVLCLSNAWDYKEVMNYMMNLLKGTN